MKKSVFTLVLVVLVVAGLVFMALCGAGTVIQPVSKGVVLGLDLVGGSEITYEAVIPTDYDDSKLAEDMDVARAMLQDRLNDRDRQLLEAKNALDNVNQTQTILGNLGRFVAWTASGTNGTAAAGT